jgi:hypothetical protein
MPVVAELFRAPFLPPSSKDLQRPFFHTSIEKKTNKKPQKIPNLSDA